MLTAGFLLLLLRTFFLLLPIYAQISLLNLESDCAVGANTAGRLRGATAASLFAGEGLFNPSSGAGG